MNTWAAADAIAHFLYQPTALGRRAYATRWHHNVRLIRGRWLARICDRYDQTLGVHDAHT